MAISSLSLPRQVTLLVGSTLRRRLKRGGLELTTGWIRPMDYFSTGCHGRYGWAWPPLVGAHPADGTDEPY